MNERILVVEDEQSLRTIIRDRLHAEGYRSDPARDGEEGLRLATSESFDAIILDLMLPRKNGFDVCRDIRSAGIITPILILTARDEVTDKVVGLKLGADDYLTKPFEMIELLARLEALIRRSSISSQATPPAVYQIGALQIDIRGTTVTRDGEPIALTAREFQLLRFFVENRGATLSRDQILKEVWGYSSEAFTRTVDVHVAGLRQKIELDSKHPTLIVTVPGLGYKLTP
jgi:two-component system, OmpR family, alkaline phosphatase synthesis response regulator PhoP